MIKRWEYCTEIVHPRDGSGASSSTHVHTDDVDAALNRLGAEGWEVWQLDGSILRLKREIPDGGFHPS